MRHKRTATERVTENADPLLAKKKVREPAQMAPLTHIVCYASYQFFGANPSFAASLQPEHCFHEGFSQAYHKGCSQAYHEGSSTR